MNLPLNKIICGDCLEVMKDFPDNSIDLVVTSPPYDNLRTYEGFLFNYAEIIRELFRTIKQGGIVVWVVGDAVENNMAKDLGRDFIGIDISPNYCKIAERRLMNVIPDMFLTKINDQRK